MTKDMAIILTQTTSHLLNNSPVEVISVVDAWIGSADDKDGVARFTNVLLK